MGIIKNLKVHYRGELVAYILQIIEDKLIPETATAKDVSAKVTLLQAIQFAADSWRNVTSTTCVNCFARCGFKASTSEELEEAEEELILQRVNNHEEFSCIDDELPCCNVNDNFDEEVIEHVAKKNKSDKDESDDDDDPVVPISAGDAKKCVDQLRQYFMQEGNEESPVAELNICADFVQRQIFKNLQQSKLNRFLQ
ncbi:hypothetical protein PGB90_007462 [Kerria lacca]